MKKLILIISLAIATGCNKVYEAELTYCNGIKDTVIVEDDFPPSNYKNLHIDDGVTTAIFSGDRYVYVCNIRTIRVYND